MIVDDQKPVRSLLAEIFKNDNWDVLLAVNGQDALEKFASDQVDLILMDMKMPVLNGLDAAKKMIEQQKEARIILMTAFGEDALQDEAKALGIKACIIKPFDIATLKATANMFIND